LIPLAIERRQSGECSTFHQNWPKID